MIKLGSPSEEMKSMSVKDIFLSRLKLLVIMAKKYSLGKYRKFTIIEKANIRI